MIKDTIENYKKYTGDIEKGLEFLYKTDFNCLEDGKHILSEDMYVNIERYNTKSDGDFEAHRRYIDIQYIIEGEEKIGVTSYDSCEKKVEYDEARDIEFLKGAGDYVELRTGEFMVLYPNDAHKPSISINKEHPTNVRKAVVKVHVKNTCNE